MQGIDESGGETAAVHCAAVKSGIDLVTIGTLPGQIVADLEIGDQHGVSLFQDGERVAEVIVVAVREQHMRDTLGGVRPPPFPGRVIGQKRIDQDLGRAHLDAKCGMAVPRQFHWNCLLGHLSYSVIAPRDEVFQCTASIVSMAPGNAATVLTAIRTSRRDARSSVSRPEWSIPRPSRSPIPAPEHLRNLCTARRAARCSAQTMGPYRRSTAMPGYSGPHGRTRMIVFPLIRLVGLNAATASSRVETVPMFVRSRPSRTRWTISTSWARSDSTTKSTARPSVGRASVGPTMDTSVPPARIRPADRFWMLPPMTSKTRSTPPTSSRASLSRSTN